MEAALFTMVHCTTEITVMYSGRLTTLPAGQKNVNWPTLGVGDKGWMVAISLRGASAAH